MLIIDCPSCFARFRVPLGVIPSEGRDFRCSACGHVWHYIDPLEEIPSESSLPKAENTIEIPPFQDVIREVIRASDSGVPVFPVHALSNGIDGWRPCVAGYMVSIIMAVGILWILVLSQATITAIIPRLAVVYQLFGIYVPPTAPLVFQDVTLDRDENHLTIKGQIENKTERQRNLPSIRAILVTEEKGQKSEAWVFRAEKTFIDVQAKGETVPFSITRATEKADQVTTVRLEFVDVR